MLTMRRPVGAEGGIHWTWIWRGGRFSSLAKRSSCCADNANAYERRHR